MTQIQYYLASDEGLQEHRRNLEKELAEVKGIQDSSCTAGEGTIKKFLGEVNEEILRRLEK